MLKIKLTPFAALLALALTSPSMTRAQSKEDFDALKKRVVELEAETKKLKVIAADDKQVVVQQEQSKLKLSDAITELKLYGDVGVRYQYNQADFQLDAPQAVGSTAFSAAKSGNVPNVNQQSRFRFKLRLFADVKLGDQFFGGFGLSTNQASDANYQNFSGGYDKFGIYIAKAFLGWKPNDWFSVIVGKQDNPFYTTNLVWDPDIFPQGIVETVDLGKLLFPDNKKFSLQLVALQGAFHDNDEFAVGHSAGTDAWQFAEQLKATYKFDKDTSLTLAPGFMTYTSANLNGLLNNRAFSGPQDVLPAAAAVQTQTVTTTTATTTVKYDATGKQTITTTPTNITTTITTFTPPTGSPRTVTQTVTNTQHQVTVATGVVNAALKNQTFVSTKTTGGGTVTVTSPVGATPGAETRNLNILTAPGDLTFKLAGLKTQIYWDMAYNFSGGQRFTEEYLMNSNPLIVNNHTERDNLAWLIGVKLGQNKKAGDWSLSADYREVGLTSVDPNINDSDVGLSALNIRAITGCAIYNITDSLSARVMYSHGWNLKNNLIGGEATGGAAIANLNSVDVVQFDLGLKF